MLLLLFFSIFADDCKHFQPFKWADYMNVSNTSPKCKPITNEYEFRMFYPNFTSIGYVGKFCFFGTFIWVDELSHNYFLYGDKIFHKNGTLILNISTVMIYDSKFFPLSTQETYYGSTIQTNYTESPECICSVNNYCSIKNIFCGEIVNCTKNSPLDTVVREITCDRDCNRIPRLMILSEWQNITMADVDKFLDYALSLSVFTEKESKGVLSTADELLNYMKKLIEVDVDIIIKHINMIKHVLNCTVVGSHPIKFEFFNFNAELAEFKNQTFKNIKFNSSEYNVQFDSDSTVLFDAKMSVIYWKSNEFFGEINKNQQMISTPLDVSLYNSNAPDFTVKMKFMGQYNQSALCSYLNLSSKVWQSDGCQTISKSWGSLCQCEHLTNFALLFDPDIEAPKWMSTLTLVGLGLSMLGEALTFLYSIILLRKKRQSHSLKIFSNLSIAMLIMNAIFAFGINEGNKSCGSIGFLLHYFLLTCFGWMTVQGCFAFFMFVRVIGSIPNNFDLVSFFLAWGLPLIPPFMVLSVNWKLYYQDKICWLDDVPLYLTVYLPVLACIVFNFGIFCAILLNFKKRKKEASVQSTLLWRKKREYYMTFTLIFLFGITWIFGFFIKMTDSIAVELLFVILNAFQGLYIFILRFISK